MNTIRNFISLVRKAVCSNTFKQLLLFELKIVACCGLVILGVAAYVNYKWEKEYRTPLDRETIERGTQALMEEADKMQETQECQRAIKVCKKYRAVYEAALKCGNEDAPYYKSVVSGYARMCELDPLAKHEIEQASELGFAFHYHPEYAAIFEEWLDQENPQL